MWQDLGRTFPSLGLFSEGGPMRAPLDELLWVVCSLPTGLPYQQGMSHLGGGLLLHLHEPRLAAAAVSACH
eukprot:3801908-Prymnesium_polylepis.1